MHFKHMNRAIFLLAAISLFGCTSPPTGPEVLVLPGTGKTYEQFRQDDSVCRQYAADATNGAGRRPTDAGLNSALAGTAVGTVAGALAGSAGGNAGSGAVIGAGAGLLAGSAAGINNSASRDYGTQRQYDNVYLQCMYAKGNVIPAPGIMSPDFPPIYSSPG